jgi:hypothetical protein
LLDKKVSSNGWVGTVGDLWKGENAKFKVEKQDKLILILRFYPSKPRNQETVPKLQNSKTP